MASDEYLDELERRLHENLAYHEERYHRAVDPILKQLAEIHQLRPRRVLIPLQDAIAAGLIPTQL